MYKIELSKNVDKFLNKNKGQPIISQFQKAILELKQNPFSEKLDIKSIQNSSEPKYRLRLGDFRFIYVVYEKEIKIYFEEAGARGDIYKNY